MAISKLARLELDNILTKEVLEKIIMNSEVLKLLAENLKLIVVQ